jgi:hypothetical protein
MGIIQLGGGAGSSPVGSSSSIILPTVTPAPGELIAVDNVVCIGEPIPLPAQVPADGVIELESITLPGYGVHVDYLIELFDVAKIRGDNEVLIYQASTGLYNHGDVHSIITFPVTSVFTRTGDVVALYADYAASLVTYIPTSPMSALNVQGAIDELTTLYAKNFLELDDTPSDYTGQAGRYVTVNGLEDALEFAFVATVNYDPVSDTYYLPPTTDGQVQNLGQEVFMNVIDETLTPQSASDPKVYMVVGTSIPNPDFLKVSRPNAGDLRKGIPFGLNTTAVSGVTGRFKLVTYGYVKSVDTSAWTVGDLLWVDPVNRGEMTNVEPVENPFAIGIVAVEDNTNGVIFVSTIYPIGVSEVNLAGVVHQTQWFTGDAASGAPTFYAVKLEDQGIVGSVQLSVIVDDNQTLPLPSDFLSPPFPIPARFFKGTYNGRVEVEIDDGRANEVITIEIYRADSAGVAIDSGILSEPVGDLGVRPLAVLKSDIRNMSAVQRYDISVSGILREEVTIPATNRFLGHILCTKLGTEGPAKTFDVYVGNLHNTFVRNPPARVLNDLFDVNITSPATNQFITYNGSYWINSNLGSIDLHSDVDTTTTPPSLNEVLKWDGGDWIPGVGSTLYSNATPMPEEVGGYEIGTTFLDQDNDDMWDGLLYPYQYPAFTGFLINGQSSTLEAGVDVAGGVRTFLWSTSNPSNIQTNIIDIFDVTGGFTPLALGLANDGTEDVNIGTAKVQTVHNLTWIWRINALNSKAQNFSRDYTVRWYSPTYYGVSAPAATTTAIQGMTKLIQAKANRTYAFSPTVQVFYYAFPASFGVLTSILDANGFETIGDWTLRVENFNLNSPDYEGVTTSYNIYEFNNLTTQVAFNNTFKF